MTAHGWKYQRVTSAKCEESSSKRWLKTWLGKIYPCKRSPLCLLRSANWRPIQTLGTTYHLWLLRPTLEGWFRREKKEISFAISCVCRGLSNHLTNCYLYMMDPTKTRKGKEWRMNFDIPSSLAPVHHNTTNLPVPEPLLRNQSCLAKEASYDDFEEEQSASSAETRRCQVVGERCPYYSKQKDINNLYRNMALT